MFTTLLLLFFIGLIFLSKKGEKYFKQRAIDMAAKERYDEDYKNRTLKALEDMSDAFTPEELETLQEPSLLENFLEGNKELEEKRKVRQAMKDELGIY
jgi:hypothetical protein